MLLQTVGPYESWTISEKKILDACAEHLHIPVAPSEIERAHRLGQFLRAKRLPIIVKFANCKQKEGILSHFVSAPAVSLRVRITQALPTSCVGSLSNMVAP